MYQQSPSWVTLTVVEVIFYIALKVRNSTYKSAPYTVEQHDGFFRSDTLLGYALNKNINIKCRKAEVSDAKPNTVNIFDVIVQTDGLGNRIVDILTCDIIYESYKNYKKQFNNDNFYLVVYPGEQSIVPHLKTCNLKMVDLSKAIDQANMYLCFIPKDGHPTAYMNKILATRLAIDVNERSTNQDFK